MTDIPNHWAQGWAFFKSAGKGFVPNEDDPELIEWVKGFGASYGRLRPGQAAP